MPTLLKLLQVNTTLLNDYDIAYLEQGNRGDRPCGQGWLVPVKGRSFTKKKTLDGYRLSGGFVYVCEMAKRLGCDMVEFNTEHLPRSTRDNLVEQFSGFGVDPLPLREENPVSDPTSAIKINESCRRAVKMLIEISEYLDGENIYTLPFSEHKQFRKLYSSYLTEMNDCAHWVSCEPELGEDYVFRRLLNAGKPYYFHHTKEKVTSLLEECRKLEDYLELNWVDLQKSDAAHAAIQHGIDLVSSLVFGEDDDLINAILVSLRRKNAGNKNKHVRSLLSCLGNQIAEAKRNALIREEIELRKGPRW